MPTFNFGRTLTEEQHRALGGKDFDNERQTFYTISDWATTSFWSAPVIRSSRRNHYVYFSFHEDEETAKRRKKTFAELPQSTRFGEIEGWRSWKIAITDDGPRLESSAMEMIWPGGLVGPDDGKGNSSHVFDERHDAGWFAYKTAAQLMTESEGEDVRVGGRVRLWGNVVEHEKGYRSEYMQILSLTVIDARANLVIDELRDFYLKGN